MRLRLDARTSDDSSEPSRQSANPVAFHSVLAIVRDDNVAEGDPMTMPRRGTRTIVVDDVRYRWKPSPNDGYMSIVVESCDAPGQCLIAMLRYHDVQLADESRQKIKLAAPHRRLTPQIARGCILLGLARGWDPRASRPGVFNLGDVDTQFPLDDEAVNGLRRVVTAPRAAPLPDPAA
jgi:hypothetical protein